MVSGDVKGLCWDFFIPAKVGGRNSSNFTVAYVSFKWVVKKKHWLNYGGGLEKKDKSQILQDEEKMLGQKIMAKKTRCILYLEKSRLLAKFEPSTWDPFPNLATWQCHSYVTSPGIHPPLEVNEKRAPSFVVGWVLCWRWNPSQLLPWKLTCPLKINGWSMYSLLK